MAVVLAIVIGAIFLIIAFKMWLTITVGKCKSRASLAGKTAIVTGSNTGIGFWTAFDFANRNGRVILACRDMKKGEEAVQKIIIMTGNKDVRLKHLDLSSLKSVRKFAEEINKEETHLDILVNNAGVTGLPKLMTEDDLERTFAINYFGPFLLTNLLLDLMKKSSSSRIVNLSSIAHKMGSIKFDDLRLQKSYGVGAVYFDSKLAIVLFTRELSKRLEGTGVTVNSLHPGNIKTELCRSMSIFNKAFLLFAGTLFFYIKTPVEGAQTSIYLAVSDEVEGISGEYFVDCGVASPAKQAMDEVVARKLWNVSCEMTGFQE